MLDAQCLSREQWLHGNFTEVLQCVRDVCYILIEQLRQRSIEERCKNLGSNTSSTKNAHPAPSRIISIPTNIRKCLGFASKAYYVSAALFGLHSSMSPFIEQANCSKLFFGPNYFWTCFHVLHFSKYDGTPSNGATKSYFYIKADISFGS